MRRLVLIVSAALFIILPGSAFAEAKPATQNLEQLLIRSAVGAQEHAALASHFRSKAAMARADAEREKKMGRSILYTHGNAGMQRYLKERRSEKAQRHLASAESFEAQAERHAAEAARIAGESGEGSGDEHARSAF